MKIDLAGFRAGVDVALGRGRSLPRRRRLLLALGILAASFAVRALYAVDLAGVMYSHRQPGTRMAGRYDEQAMGMLRGEGVLFPAVRPAREDTGLLARPPGYAVFLAGVYALLGRSFFAVQLVQNVLNSVSPVLIFLIAGRVVSWRVGTVAGLIAAVSPPLAYASNFVLPDALCALPLLAAIYLLTRGDPDGRSGLWLAAAAGTLVGVAAWLRPNVMLLGPFLGALLWLVAFRRRRAAVRGLVLSLASVLAIAPITLRNYVVYGELVPISINGGITLWQGVAAAGGQRFGAAPRDKLVIAEETTRHGDPRYEEWWASPDGIRRDRERYRRAMAVILEHPLWYAGAMFRRMAQMVDYGSGEVPLVRPADAPPLTVERPDTSALHAERPAVEPSHPPRLAPAAATAPGRWLSPARPGVRLLQSVAAGLSLPLLLVGAAVVLPWSWRGGVFLLMLPLYYFVFESMFIYEWRVAVPMHYGLFVFAAVALVLAGDVSGRGLARAWRRVRPRTAPGQNQAG